MPREITGYSGGREFRIFRQPTDAAGNSEPAIHLDPSERKILDELKRSPGRVLTPQQLLKPLWGEVPDIYITQTQGATRTYIAKLRKKGFAIHTIRFRGYTLSSPQELVFPDHEQVKSAETQYGTMRYNHEALLATSPLVDNGSTPIQVFPHGGLMLQKLIEANHPIPLGYFIPHMGSMSRVRVELTYLRRHIGDSRENRKYGEGLIGTTPAGIALARPLRPIPSSV